MYSRSAAKDDFCNVSSPTVPISRLRNIIRNPNPYAVHSDKYIIGFFNVNLFSNLIKETQQGRKIVASLTLRKCISLNNNSQWYHV